MTKQTLKAAIIVGVAVGLLAIFNLTGLGSASRNAFLLISSPWQSFFWQPNQFSDRLEAEVVLLKAQIAKLQTFKSENQDLRKALGLGLEKEFSLMMADVVGKDPLEDAIFINQGEKDVLKPGLAVINAEKVFIGQIETVLENYSRVRLTSDKQSSLAALIQGKNGEVNALARGQGGQQINLELIPQTAEITPGDLVVSAGRAGDIPKGLLLGEVNEINSVDTQPFKSAKLKPAFDPGSLKILFVILDF